MAIISDPTVVGFNSFVSVEEADAYFSGTYFGTSKTWADQVDVQEALLITGTRRMNSLNWRGTPQVAGQALAFPRSFSTYNEYGYSASAIADVPEWLKRATFEMAKWIWTEDDRPISDVEFSMLKSQKIGPLDQTFRDGASIAPEVMAILSGLGEAYIDLGALSGVRRARGGRLVY